MIRLTFILATALVASGCDIPTQYSSGAAYLAKSQPIPDRLQPRVQHTVVDGEVVASEVETVSTDTLVRHAASIEPLLQLPARIGLARIDKGKLTTIPRAEQSLWQEMGSRHRALGSLAGLDPFVTRYAMQTVLPSDRRALRRDASDLITAIRVGAARQHMDAVLIYEVGARQPGEQGLGRVHVLGDVPLPAQPIENEGIARAFLMDVRNGYPYGVASVSVSLEEIEQGFWDDSPRDRQGIEAKAKVTGALIPEIETMLGALTTQMRVRMAQAK